MTTLIHYEKEIANSEAFKKLIVEGYLIRSEGINGGGQASYNFPTEMFERLVNEKVLIKNDDFSRILSYQSQSLNAYSLSDNYKLLLGKDVLSLINHDIDVKFGFFVVEYDGIKPQIRHTNYERIGKFDTSKDYGWFKKLYMNNYVNSIMKYTCDMTKKEFTINVKHNYNVTNIVNDNLISEEASMYDAALPDKNPVQTIFFGAPGTGKSYQISKFIKENEGLDESFPIDSVNDLENVFRVTIHPDFSYSDFVGSVLPVVIDKNITYEFVPGIFTRALCYAIKDINKMTYLVIEEMNRGNVAGIFGDVFQLLDRKLNGESEYRINNDLISKQLRKSFEGIDASEDQGRMEFDKIFLPCNFSILGSVNSTDQNVYIMDTAFKRRFDFKYVSTEPVKDPDNNYINDFTFYMHKRKYSWITFYQRINEFIIVEAGLKEDKQIGQFFIKGNDSKSEDVYRKNSEIIKNKLLHYLWSDVNSNIYNKSSLFMSQFKTFHEIYDAFDKNSAQIFNIELESVFDGS